MIAPMSEQLEELSLAVLRPSERNPRIMTDRVQRKLRASLERFGDLGCIVLNETSGNLVGGTQRTTTIALDPASKFYITSRNETPDTAGTVAEGYIEYLGTKYKVRHVRWDSATETAARIAANALHADWDTTMLGEEVRGLMETDMDLARLTSFEDDQLKVLADGGMLGEKPDGKMTAKPKQAKYSQEDLEAHKNRFLVHQQANGSMAEVVLNDYLAFIKAGEPES
jgi:hypothetical protein